jgi:4-hydroxy-tetrahydrodipicolinate reductase
LRLAIIGYGKMGRLIEQLAPEFGLDVGLKLDIDENCGGSGLTRQNFRSIDVAVEFTTPASAVANIEGVAALGVNMVVSTTGWMDQLPRVRAAVERAGTGLVYSPNFSVGVQVFTRVVETAARWFEREPDYGAWAYEIHHKMKKDAPSGTLLLLRRAMEQAGYSRPIDVAANRAGSQPGTHQIGFDSEADTILLTHTARSRLGFARGALKAARWVVGKKGVYDFSEVLFQGG